jgi:hypothetical protein
LHLTQCRSESNAAVQQEAARALSNAVAVAQLVTTPTTAANNSSNADSHSGSGSSTTVTAHSSTVKKLINVSNDGRVTLQADVATRVQSLLHCEHFSLLSVPTATLLMAATTATTGATGVHAVTIDVAATAAAYGHTHSKQLQLPMAVLHSVVYGTQHRYSFESSGDALHNCLCIPVHTASQPTSTTQQQQPQQMSLVLCAVNKRSTATKHSNNSTSNSSNSSGFDSADEALVRVLAAVVSVALTSETTVGDVAKRGQLQTVVTRLTAENTTLRSLVEVC